MLGNGALCKSTMRETKGVPRQELAGGRDEVALGTREVNARAYCSWYNFRGADQQKKVGDLSGGERNRLQLAKTLAGGGNVLMLNDLDVATCGRWRRRL